MKATEGGQRGPTSRTDGAVNKSRSHVGAVAQKLRDSRLTAAAGTMEVAGDRIDTPPFSDGQEATEVWVGKEVVFIVG